jgi:HAMP domain-containing protein
MSDQDNQLVKAQFMSLVPAGSILSKVLAELPAEEIARLKSQAADGMLAIEINKIITQHKLQVTATEIDILLQGIRGLQREHQGATSSYSVNSTINTASGQTHITSKKGGCLGVIIFFLVIGLSGISYAAWRVVKEPAPPTMGTCTGSFPCTACKTCSACKFCHIQGGTCGVCAPAPKSAVQLPVSSEDENSTVPYPSYRLRTLRGLGSNR